jgi:hypothetical protein
MANPFFSGRIPPGLADKIDAHLLATGETRSELLIRLLRAEVNDNKEDNVGDNINDIKIDNTILNLVARVERLEKLIDNSLDNKINLINDDKGDNNEIDPSNWVNLSTVAAELQVLPKSISGACSRRGQNIGNDTIEFEISGQTIYKKGSGLKALYQVLR